MHRMPPADPDLFCGWRLSGSLWRPTSEVIVRRVDCAVKAVKVSHKEVILSIATDGYKALVDFVLFAHDKNYDGFEKIPILVSCPAHPAAQPPTCE